MKQFNNLAEAVMYHRKCYVCGERMSHGLTAGNNPEHNIYQWNLSENVDSYTDDYIVVNAHSNHVEYFQEMRKSHSEMIYGIDEDYSGQTTIKKTYSPKYTGTVFESVHVRCNKCHQFSYTIQLVIDVSALFVTGIFLNSEFISYEGKNGIVHEIKNIYSIDKTEYTYYGDRPDGGKKLDDRMSIPLVPLNLQDPDETVARIRKLVVFS